MGYEMEAVRDKVMKQMDLSREMPDEEIEEVIEGEVSLIAKETAITIEDRVQLEREIFNSMRKLDVLQELLEEDDITEIMVNGREHIFYEKAGELYEWDKQFYSEEKLLDTIHQIAGMNNRMVNESSPIVDTRLKDGSRINIVLHPIAIDGSTISIRKFPKESLTMERLIRMGALSGEVAEFLGLLVETGYNIFISGGTGSGKTTFLNALAEYIPKSERLITIEDSAELQIKGIANLVRLETRNASCDGSAQVTIRDLIKTALRMRPTRIIVGECRGTEALDMLQAMNTGHDGSLSTGHSNSAADMLSRLETMVLMGAELPLPAIRRQIASGIDILIHLGRMRDCSRKVLEILEMDGMSREEIVLRRLCHFQEKGEIDGKIQGEWIWDHPLRHQDKLRAAGYEPVMKCGSEV